MKRVLLSIVLLAFAGAVSADGYGDLGWGVKGNLAIDRTLSAGSGVGVGSDASGSLRMDAPGRTTVGAWALNRTSVRSATTVTRNCGRCGGLNLRTSSSGQSVSKGGATGVITPRRDPVRASFGAYGDGVAFTEFTRSFELNVKGHAEFEPWQF